VRSAVWKHTVGKWVYARILTHYTTLHYTTLHYTTLHFTALHYTTLHCTTHLHAMALSFSTTMPGLSLRLAAMQRCSCWPSSSLCAAAATSVSEWVYAHTRKGRVVNAKAGGAFTAWNRRTGCNLASRVLILLFQGTDARDTRVLGVFYVKQTARRRFGTCNPNVG
jgi:hypothetical protein